MSVTMGDSNQQNIMDNDALALVKWWWIQSKSEQQNALDYDEQLDPIG